MDAPFGTLPPFRCSLRVSAQATPSRLLDRPQVPSLRITCLSRPESLPARRAPTPATNRRRSPGWGVPRGVQLTVARSAADHAPWCSGDPAKAQAAGPVAASRGPLRQEQWPEPRNAGNQGIPTGTTSDRVSPSSDSRTFSLVSRRSRTKGVKASCSTSPNSAAIKTRQRPACGGASTAANTARCVVAVSPVSRTARVHQPGVLGFACGPVNQLDHHRDSLGRHDDCASALGATSEAGVCGWARRTGAGLAPVTFVRRARRSLRPSSHEQDPAPTPQGGRPSMGLRTTRWLAARCRMSRRLGRRAARRQRQRSARSGPRRPSPQ